MEVNKKEVIDMAKKYGFIGSNIHTINVSKFVIFLFSKKGDKLTYDENRGSASISSALMKCSFNGEITFETLNAVLRIVNPSNYFTQLGIEFINKINGAFNACRIMNNNELKNITEDANDKNKIINNTSDELCKIMNDNKNMYEANIKHNFEIQSRLQKIVESQKNIIDNISGAIFGDVYETVVYIETCGNFYDIFTKHIVRDIDPYTETALKYIKNMSNPSQEVTIICKNKHNIIQEIRKISSSLCVIPTHQVRIDILRRTCEDVSITSGKRNIMIICIDDNCFVALSNFDDLYKSFDNPNIGMSFLVISEKKE